MSYAFDPAALDLLRRVGGDSLVSRMFDAFRASALAMTKGLTEAKRSGDRAAVARYAHSLASTAGQLGLVQLCEAAQRIETGLSGEGGLSASGSADELIGEMNATLAWLGSRTTQSP